MFTNAGSNKRRIVRIRRCICGSTCPLLLAERTACDEKSGLILFFSAFVGCLIHKLVKMEKKILNKKKTCAHAEFVCVCVGVCIEARAYVPDVEAQRAPPHTCKPTTKVMCPTKRKKKTVSKQKKKVSRRRRKRGRSKQQQEQKEASLENPSQSRARCTRAASTELLSLILECLTSTRRRNVRATLLFFHILLGVKGDKEDMSLIFIVAHFRSPFHVARWCSFSSQTQT